MTCPGRHVEPLAWREGHEVRGTDEAEVSRYQGLALLAQFVQIRLSRKGPAATRCSNLNVSMAHKLALDRAWAPKSRRATSAHIYGQASQPRSSSDCLFRTRADGAGLCWAARCFPAYGAPGPKSPVISALVHPWATPARSMGWQRCGVVVPGTIGFHYAVGAGRCSLLKETWGSDSTSPVCSC